jgi:hypothetical protein
MSILEYIASYDDLIQFCGSDEDLGKKHKNVFSEKEERSITFDPYISAASNKDALNDDTDIWTNPKSGKAGMRKKGFFDATKYTVLFITRTKEHLEDTEKSKLERIGFDPYAYLVTYEEDIKNEYKDTDVSLIQKACLHFIEFGYDTKPVDYLRYMASYTDVIIGAYTAMQSDVELSDWIPKFAEYHYVNVGRDEIMKGTRSVEFIFDPTKYVATYVPTKDVFTDPVTGIINEHAATMAYITIGATHGLQPDLFNPYVFISNYPELVKEDIYVKDADDGEISKKKLSKIWIDKFPHNIDLTKFNLARFKSDSKIEDDIEAFKVNALNKIKIYQKELLAQKSVFIRIWRSLSFGCLSAPNKE